MEDEQYIPIERACRFAVIMLERVSLTNTAGDRVFEDEQAKVLATLRVVSEIQEGTLPVRSDCVPPRHEPL